MNYTYKRCTIEDIDILTKVRITVLRAANMLDNAVDMENVRKQSYDYYLKSLKDNIHVAYIVLDSDTVIATGGISYYRVMPTYHNQTGYKAYIMNMYTDPQYRRKGIAFSILDKLVEDAKERGIEYISLEATDMGKPLYDKYGFIKLNDEMILK